jgi:hypothetical protein
MKILAQNKSMCARSTVYETATGRSEAQTAFTKLISPCSMECRGNHIPDMQRYKCFLSRSDGANASSPEAMVQ